MNENKAVSMYEAVPAVSELNKVPGFNPLKFLRRTKDGDWKLDLKIKKLWFRLKYPTGRIKLSALKITDQLAIIEARVYFDKNDAQPVTSFTAQRENKTTPGGLYIESAQHSAIDEALSAAGFGIQFVPAKETGPAPVQRTAAAVQESAEQEKTATQEVSAPAVEEVEIISEPEQETVAEKQAPIETAMEEVAAAAVSESPVISAEDVAAPVEEAETIQEEVTEVQEVEETSAYTKEMPVDEICSLMTVEEAGNIIVPAGTCKGWTLAQVADRRPASLRWYVKGYQGENNVLRAAAAIIWDSLQEKQAG